MSGTPFDLVVNTSGNTPFTYQWRKNTTFNIAGATGSVYNIANAMPIDTGNYDCEVISASGLSSISSTANLTVLQTLTIIIHPVGMTRNETETGAFITEAIGVAPISYQYEKWNTGLGAWEDVSGANPQYDFDNITLADAGKYRCRVTDALATIYSNEVTLVVLPAGVQPELQITFSPGVQPNQLSGGIVNLHGADFLSLFESPPAGKTPADVTLVVIRLVDATPLPVSVIGAVGLAGIPADGVSTPDQTFDNAAISASYNGLIRVALRFDTATSYYLRNDEVKVVLTYGGTGHPLAVEGTGWRMDLTAPLLP
jgi:hypothetical protein